MRDDDRLTILGGLVHGRHHDRAHLAVRVVILEQPLRAEEATVACGGGAGSTTQRSWDRHAEAHAEAHPQVEVARDVAVHHEEGLAVAEVLAREADRARRAQRARLHRQHDLHAVVGVRLEKVVHDLRPI
eukprot:6105129-Prymnesium_polylepis.1